jgi:hypothetical protein
MKSSRSFKFQFKKLHNFKFLEEFNIYQNTSLTNDFNNNGSEFSTATAAGRSFIGHVQILDAPEDQKFDLVISVTTNATNDFLTENIKQETTDSSVTLSLPSPFGYDETAGCLAVNVSMYFRRNLTLENLIISPMMSNVEFLQDIGLVVSDTTGIDIKAGWLNAKPFPASRKTQINVSAGGVRGEYPLYDVLWINSQAGSVRVHVIPKPIDEENPAPAELRVYADAGSIDIAFPPPNITIPDRDYFTDIKTARGSVTGNYIHGKDTSLVTGAGRIAAKVLPFLDDTDTSRNSTFHTATDAGIQDIELLSPYKNAGVPIRNLTSTHVTALGGLKVRYPSEWEGFIDGKTTMGSLALDGKGVKIIEAGSVGLTGRYVQAKKGEGDSSMIFRSEIGGADCFFR